jgi:hypothetical protein
MDENTLPRITPRLILGLALIFFGVVFTLDNFRIIDAGDLWLYSPLVLVVMGLARLWNGTFWRGPAGIVLIVLGIIFTLNNLRLLHFRIVYLFPLLLAFVGLRIVLGQFPKGRWPVPAAGAAAGQVSGMAVFGGVERKLGGGFFSGGEMVAVFGGFNVDLRGATMVGDEAHLDVFAFCGGGDIKVPEDWNVSITVLPVFGGTDDKSRHPAVEPGKTIKQLVVTGFVLFGGVGIKN